MIQTDTLEDRVAARYANLSAQLQKAADYVVANPLDIASRPLRQISGASGVSPATFSRLARALGYDGFDTMKELARDALGPSALPFSEKARQLQETGPAGQSMLIRQGRAVTRNIETLLEKTDDTRLTAAATCLARARTVLVFGALGSTGLAEYMAYLAGYFAPNWTLAGRMGASPGAALSQLGPDDVLFVITKRPYVTRAVAAARQARSAGANVVLVTDLHRCPALAHATHAFIVPSESPQFFSSYAATMVLIESLIAMIVAQSQSNVTAAIRAVEDTNQQLGEYWADPKTENQGVKIQCKPNSN